MNITTYDLKTLFIRERHTDIARQYQDAYDWFGSFGFSLAATRLHSYKHCIDELASHMESGTLASAQFRKSFPKQVTALFEASEILRIYHGLADLYSAGLREKIRWILSGKDGRPSPDEFDPSRDVGFELLIAARCRRAGFTVDITSRADIVLSAFGRNIYLECKRLKSSQKVRKRIKEALKQLHARYKSDSSTTDCRRLLALSITDLVNPRHGLLPDQTPETVSQAVERHLDRFIFSQQKTWQEMEDRRSIGVIVELSTPTMVESENLFTTCHFLGMNNICSQETDDWNILVGIAKRLAEQIAQPCK